MNAHLSSVAMDYKIYSTAMVRKCYTTLPKQTELPLLLHHLCFLFVLPSKHAVDPCQIICAWDNGVGVTSRRILFL